MKKLMFTVTTTSQCADIVSIIMFDFGAEGVIILDKEDIADALGSTYWDYVDERVFDLDERVFVSALLPHEFDKQLVLQRLEQLRQQSEFDTGSLELDVQEFDTDTYVDEWKKYYEPFTIGEITVIPEWLRKQTHPQGRHALYLNPGKAFGTGSHQTTSMCISLMQRIVLTGKDVIDLGCGSGILGIAARLLGASRLTMLDIDINAIEASCENCGYNGISDAEIRQDGLRANESCDIMLANMTTPVLKMLALDIDRVVKTHLIISGIIDTSEQEALNSFPSFEVIEHIRQDDWHAYLLKRR